MSLIKNAIISDDLKYRYVLTRYFDEYTNNLLYWVMLNPSTADADIDDATIRICMGRAKLLGYGGIVVLNLFALRATNPKELYNNMNPIGNDNDEYLKLFLSETDNVIAAWGNHGAYLNRNLHIIKLCNELNINLLCLGKTKDHHPKHPLRISYNTPLIEYKIED